MKIPFKWMPGSWGLKGSVYDEAEANYYLTGEELDRKLLSIRHKDDPNVLFLKQLEIDVKYNKLSPYDAAIRKIDILNKPDSLEHQLAKLEIEFKFGNITKNEHDKRGAILKNEPWVSFVDSGFDPKQGIDGVFFELDWNPQWVEFLDCTDMSATQKKISLKIGFLMSEKLCAKRHW